MDLEGLSARKPRDGRVLYAVGASTLSSTGRELLLVFILASFKKKMELPWESKLLGDLRSRSLDVHTASSADLRLESRALALGESRIPCCRRDDGEIRRREWLGDGRGWC